MENNKDLYFIGEDIMDPYGGAFKVSKGLSTKYPKRVLSTPISELAIAGIGNGLALSGQKVIVEFMFADFVFLAFDQIINFAAKTVSMYGTNIKHKILFRCPVGGNRGYGPTHSQSVQKHFIGIPNLDLYELSPLHDCHNLLTFIFETGNPSMLFENKVIYAKDRILDGFFLEFFNHIKINPLNSLVFIEKRIDVLLISGGGLVYDCINVAKKLFLEHEISVHIINPLKIYPFDFSSFENLILEAKFVVTVEESTEGGIWGSEISNVVSKNLPNNEIKFLCLSSKNSIIPSSRHLESEILINSDYIFENILKAYKLWKK
jgi:pyruvate dehydrogenase E1 component beta subunit